MDETTYDPLLNNLNAIVETVMRLKKDKHRVVIVSSGAMGVGLHRMKYTKKPKHLSQLQVCLKTAAQSCSAILIEICAGDRCYWSMSADRIV